MLFLNGWQNVLDLNMNVMTYLYVAVVLDTNQWFHSTIILGSNISIAIGSEYD